MTLPQVHHHHLAELRSLPAVLDSEGLRIGDQYVMFFAEAELMREHATHLLAGSHQADVLEVGLGLGVFAEQLLPLGVGSYTAIEPHEGVAWLAHGRVLKHFDTLATVIDTPWQLARLPPLAYDAIMYDTWPPDGHADLDFTRFVETVAIRCLRPGGRFSFFHSGDALSAARREILDRAFASWTSFREMILAPNHVRDTHSRVVHHVRQQKHRRPVPPGDHEVLSQRVLERRLASYEVDNGRHPTIRRPEPHRSHHDPAGRAAHSPASGPTSTLTTAD